MSINGKYNTSHVPKTGLSGILLFASTHEFGGEFGAVNLV